MSVSIFARDQHLYLLGKGARDKRGATPWWLVELDPQDGSELNNVRLPTDAAHLTVVPGGDFWALIQKGPVQGVGSFHAPYMEISSMVLMPTQWLKAASSGVPLSEFRKKCVIP